MMARRLSAILAADVVGYSRLIERNEARTLASVKDHQREFIGPLITQHGGRIFKLMGDGLLAEFPSIVDAVECAVAIQRGMPKRNCYVQDDERIDLRIGVSLGDVVSEGDDIYGDGVIIATRLEGIAHPGGICLSGTVHENIVGKLDHRFTDDGEKVLKNISRAVRVWRWIDGVSPFAVGHSNVSGSPRPKKPAVAVLPFANMSGDPNQSYLSDGVTEDVITELSRFHRLSVISATASVRFREDLGVTCGDSRIQYVVEGSVRRLGNRVRITSKVSDAATGGQLWAERYDRDFAQIFEVQDEIVKQIVGTVVGRIEAAGAERAQRKPPANLDAYECVLRGKACQIGDPVAEAEARRLFEQAIELDPDYALAHSHLSHILSLEWLRASIDADELLDRALEHSKRAVALDANEPDCTNSLGWIHLHRRSFELAEKYYRRALELNPNDAEQVAYMGVLYAFLGNFDNSISAFRQAQTLDPFFEPPWYWTIQGVAYFTAGKIDEAIGCFEQSPNTPAWVRVYLAACNALAGNVATAETERAALLEQWPSFSLNRFAHKEPLRRETDQDRLVSAMKLAQLPE